MLDTAASVTLLVCRGCCCADDDPDADDRHRWLAAALEHEPGVALRFTNCLGPCGEADVVGVRRPIGTDWLGGVGDAEVTVLIDWVRSGGDATLPVELAARVLRDPSLTFTPDHEMTLTDRPIVR